jgi:prepilin-type N-terminal cleavage/methylation domain-containing protein
MPERTTLRAEAGFTLTEVLVVIAVIGVLSAMAVLVNPAAIIGIRADSGLSQLTSQLRRAKDLAVADRRDIQVQFLGRNQIQITRLGVNGGAAQVVDSVFLENSLEFRLMPGVPDTPDGFGNAAAVDFGVANASIFRAEGIFTDDNPNLDPLNGTVFIGVPGEPSTARAVTIFGPTALIRGYCWNGSQWVE